MKSESLVIVDQNATVNTFPGVKSDVKSPGSTWELHLILASLSLVEGGRIPGVAVKCVEIWRNTGGEGGPLDED